MLCLMMLTAMWAGAATTATWDFQNDLPAGICESTNYQGVEADIASDAEGIAMHVDATSGKLYCVGRNNAQMNPGTVLQVPVSSTDDVVTVVGYPGYCHFAVGADENGDESTVEHKATNAEVKQGYVEVTATAGNNYIYKVSVVLNKSLTPAEDITGTWDYADASVMEQTMAFSGSAEEGTVAAIEGNGLVMTVAANGASFRNNGNNIQVRKGAIFKVPVKSTEDVVTVFGYPGYSYYTIGSSDTEYTNTGTNPSTEYTAKNADVAQGYVAVTSTNDNNYFLKITVVQKAQKEAEVLTDKPATATFPFTLGTEGQTAEFGDAADYFVNSKVSYGSGLFLKDANSGAGIDETRFEPYDQNNKADETNIIDFIIQPNYGLSFTPTSVALKTTRFGTDNGLLDIAWLNPDGTTVTLATEVKPNRNSGTNPAIASENGKKVSELSYEVTGATPAEGPCGLRINLYHLQSGKQIGFADIVITGVLNGQEVEVPIFGEFTANGVKYIADNVFEGYDATIELSKKVEMVSAANPLTEVKAISGEIGEIAYSGDDTHCDVTIPVTLGTVTVDYVAHFVQKPDFTLTYLDTDRSVMGTQTVEKDAPIGEFAVDFTTAKANEGFKVRGWYVKPGEKKYTTADIITGNATLYAYATEIEEPSDYKKYNFDLTSTLFYPEDHEAFVSVGNGYWHDTQHGWAFRNGDRIELLVGGKAYVNVATCKYGNTEGKLVFKNANGEELGRMAAISEGDGEISSFTYEGEPGKLYIDVESGGENYIHSIRIVNFTTTNYAKEGNWYFVTPGDANSLVEVLDIVNGANGSQDAERSFIFLPDGTYDLDMATLTAVSGHNISIIGQSEDKTIIRNAPHFTEEGIGKTATLLNSGKNLYIQDITLKNDLDYYGAQAAGLEGGRAVCFQDRGDRAIFKNVRMLSYQDTYYSQNTKQSYWEDCDVHGTVDFLCGGGDVRFMRTTISLEPRNINGTGGRTICAPTTSTNFGYVFDQCKVVDLANGKGDWNFGRTWQNYPIAVYLGTILDANAEKTLVKSRWTQKGMNNKDPKIFGEYNTMNEAYDVINPASNIITSYGGQFETILSKEQAEQFSYDNMFLNNDDPWDPFTLAMQSASPSEAAYANGQITWNAVEGAIAYAIFKNDVFQGITEKTAYDLEAVEGDIIAIRSANSMGGFGDPAEVTVEAQAEATIAILDNDQQTLPAGEYPFIKTDRQLYQGLNTIVLPFDATPEEIGASKVLEYIGTVEKDGALVLQFKPVKALEANTPYAVFADADYTIEAYENKTVAEATDLTVSDSEYDFVGTYTAYEKGESPIAEGDMIADVEEFVKANGGNKIRAYRAYLKKVGSSEANVAFDFDGDIVDGIEAARLLERMGTGNVYNLNGQKVSTTQKGVYIIDGKKVVVK